MRGGWQAITQRLDFISDDNGQDIIEYALLSALIAVVGIAVWNEIAVRVGLVYIAADGGVQNLSACTPDPGQVSCAP